MISVAQDQPAWIRSCRVRAPRTDKDRKQLLRTMLDEVNITSHRDHDNGHADPALERSGGRENLKAATSSSCGSATCYAAARSSTPIRRSSGSRADLPRADRAWFAGRSADLLGAAVGRAVAWVLWDTTTTEILAGIYEPD